MDENRGADSDELGETSGGRWLIKVGAWLLALPYLGVLVLVLTGSPTWSGVAYVLAMGLLMAGLMTLPSIKGRRRTVFGKKWPHGVSRAGLVAIFAVMFVRCCSAGEGTSLHMATSARFVDRLVDERDVALSGMRVLAGGRMLQDDKKELPIAMRDAYKQMSDEQGDAPSPFVATYLGLQRPGAYDMVMVEPPTLDGEAKPVTTAVLFLHGYAGNFSLPCWQISEAVRELNVLTACPSTDFVGHWSDERGEKIVRDAVKVLHECGITKIVIAGLSNGGYGLSELAPKMRGTFAGVVLISGARPETASAGAPVLLIHGSHDSMAGYGEAVAYKANHDNARLVTFDAGHFAMLVKRPEFNRVLRDFVTKTTGARSNAARIEPRRGAKAG